MRYATLIVEGELPRKQLFTFSTKAGAINAGLMAAVERWQNLPPDNQRPYPDVESYVEYVREELSDQTNSLIESDFEIYILEALEAL